MSLPTNDTSGGSVGGADAVTIAGKMAVMSKFLKLFYKEIQHV